MLLASQVRSSRYSRVELLITSGLHRHVQAHASSRPPVERIAKQHWFPDLFVLNPANEMTGDVVAAHEVHGTMTHHHDALSSTQVRQQIAQPPGSMEALALSYAESRAHTGRILL